MTLYSICDDNFEVLRYSLAQYGRRHTYNDATVTDIRKRGRHFQLCSVFGVWSTVPERTSVRMVGYGEKWV